MKYLLALLLSILFISNSFSQRTLDFITHEQCVDPNFYQEIKNNTTVEGYLAKDGSEIFIGDTLIIGRPSARGSISAHGVTRSASKEVVAFETVKLGKAGGFGNVMAAMNGDSPSVVPTSMAGDYTIVNKIQLYHNGSKKKPLYLIVTLGEPNGAAFGINKYLHITDLDRSMELGEIRSLYTPMSREEAIDKLKEQKELLELGVINEEEYEKIKKELSIIIKGS